MNRPLVRPSKLFMKAKLLSNLGLSSALFLAASAATQKREPPASPPPPDTTPPPVAIAPVPPGGAPVYLYEQKPLGGQQPLVGPQQAQAIIDRFKAAYPKLGNPRLLIYVNRELVDENSGLKLVARTEKIQTTSKGDAANSTENASHDNRYRLHERKEPILADKQTVRDVERLFGRPLRLGGVSLADQRVATQLMADKPPRSLATEGEQARKDREALAKIAEVVVEILISSKDQQVAGISGDRTYAVPDIQATAIRLSDSKIMGQASSSDILGRGNSSYNARNFDVRDVTDDLKHRCRSPGSPHSASPHQDEADSDRE